MLRTIPPSRQLLYVLLAGLLPIGFAWFYFQSELSSLSSARSQLESVYDRAALYEKRQSGNRAVIAYFRDSNHFYIDKFLESIPLLEAEVEALKRVTQDPNYAGDETLEKRLELLLNDNQVLFAEGSVQSNSIYQETTETLAKPIEVNINDIKKLLSRIEGTPNDVESPVEKRPQLLITDFKLDRKQPTADHETFILSLKLVKREFL